MASLLNNASLLLNPAGSIISYQEDKIYSVLPKDGTGDFTFSGGDGGTRVNQQGYIEQTPVNVYTNSNNFSTWSPKNGTFSQGVADPFGGNNAWVWTATDSDPYLYQNLNLNGIYTVSIYVKGVGSTIGDNLQIRVGGVPYGEFTLTNEWQRFEWSNTLGGFNNIGVEFGNPASIGDVVHVAFAQLNLGSTALPYQPTTDRLNYPRITYQNGRGALLSEPQRTNLATYSEDLTNGVWLKSNVSIQSNYAVSPDGTQNADGVTRTSTSSTFFYHSTATASNRANSMFFKKGTIDQVTLLGNNYSSGTFATFNLSNGTILSSAGCTPFIEQYKDGWYRCGFVQTNGVNYYLLVTLNGYNNDTVTSGEYLYAWGGQTELGEFPTTYIPTTSATVTRPLDQFFNNDSPALNTTNWTFYMSGVNIGKN